MLEGRTLLPEVRVTPVRAPPSQSSFSSSAFYPTARSAPVLSAAARLALRQPRGTVALLIDHSAGILSTLGLAGGPLINNLVRVMDSVRIIA